MFTKRFWTATGERAVRTAAQTLVATLGLDAVGGPGITETVATTDTPRGPTSI
ncbi:holin [Streptomyces sp. NRRL F-5135]|uniref:holin n=1 Tax=Streptomyces sp. NRRL F-5135 TaxID=1463858 RepID=UPI00099D9797|nr:holin [Streptomyces sp. NRRL F-5135]